MNNSVDVAPFLIQSADQTPGHKRSPRFTRTTLADDNIEKRSDKTNINLENETFPFYTTVITSSTSFL